MVRADNALTHSAGLSTGTHQRTRVLLRQSSSSTRWRLWCDTIRFSPGMVDISPSRLRARAAPIHRRRRPLARLGRKVRRSVVWRDASTASSGASAIPYLASMVVLQIQPVLLGRLHLEQLYVRLVPVAFIGLTLAIQGLTLAIQFATASSSLSIM